MPPNNAEKMIHTLQLGDIYTSSLFYTLNVHPIKKTLEHVMNVAAIHPIKATRAIQQQETLSTPPTLDPINDDDNMKICETHLHKYFFQPSPAVENESFDDGLLDSWTETFCDTDNYDLLREGIWLRLRGESHWSWKEPKQHKDGELIYREVTDINTIMRELRRRFPESKGEEPLDICSNIIAVMEVARMTYVVGASQLYIDSVLLDESKFYIVGGFIPAPNIPACDSSAILKIIVKEQPRAASSKIVEYLRHRMADFSAEIQDLFKDKLPRLNKEAPTYCTQSPFEMNIYSKCDVFAASSSKDIGTFTQEQIDDARKMVSQENTVIVSPPIAFQVKK